VRVGVLGTGMVGSTIGGKLVELGHEVMMGSRTAGGEKALEWVASAGDGASEGTFADAAAFGELVVNCTSGAHSLEALRLADSGNLGGKVLLDVANTLDFSAGRPPTLTVANTDSLGEQIQREFPETKVVKALNTMNCRVMVDPARVPGEHDVFVCGDDGDAKRLVTELLEGFGWPPGRIRDLGGIRAARGPELYVTLWVSLLGVLGTADFNIAVVSAPG
jgi:8-hydroxy-5-deazaflavin:NADPH oxidoreductase